MSYKNLINKLSPKKPALDFQYAVLSAPVRHVFMMSVIWHLTKKNDRKESDLSILEIGSWLGASALSWAQGLDEYNKSLGSITCVDAWQPFFTKEEHTDHVYETMEALLESEIAYNLFLHNIGTTSESITKQHLRGQSDNILPLLKPNSFDVVFIDADHTYKAVKKDILNSLDLVREGGVICGDDLNLQLFECDERNAFASGHLDFIQDPKTKRNFHPGVTCAVGEVFGKVSSWGGFWAMQKIGKEWSEVSLKDTPIVYPKHFSEDKIAALKDHLKDIEIK